MRKRILSLFCAGALLFTACGQSAATTQTAAESTAAGATEVTTESVESTADVSGNTADTSSNTGDTSDNTAGKEDVIPYWTENSEVMKSIVSYVSEVTDESSDSFVPVSDRIVVFDFDGTLYGELYPTYFDECLMLHRILHDDTYEAPAEVKEYAQASEEAYQKGLPQPETSLSTSAITAEAFKGMTVEEYRDYIRDFMSEPAFGFEGMTYGEGFYLPMVSLVEYLADHDFKVFISSGSERACVRELTEGVLDKWVPSDQVIGSTFSLEASGQGDEDGRKYSLKADDKVIMKGSLVTKNQKTNKVFSILDEIGKTPILVFGNSSGDLAMAQYTVTNGGKGYMLLCDDTERDYGNLETAEKFAKECAEIGLETVSMKNDFATIYKEDAVKVPVTPADTSSAEAAGTETESVAESAVESAVESAAESVAEAAEEALAPAA